MKTKNEMIRVNMDQAKFYDAIQVAEEDNSQSGYVGNKSANFLTRAWARLRCRQQAAVQKAGVHNLVQATHDRWVRTKEGGEFLEIGCFSGSPSTFLLARAAGTYLGVELSTAAVKSLNQKFATAKIAHKASAVTGDLLAMDEGRKFDLIYAHGVLHHFENPEVLFAKLSSLLKSDGVLMFVEPCAVHPIYRTIRSLFRPFQSDAAWEWPFTQRTIEALERNFAIIEGFGWGKRSLPLSVFTGVPGIAGIVSKYYMRTVQSEINAPWNSRVWHNSMVTAIYRGRERR